MAISKEDILEAVGSLTVMELNDLVKAFEEKFGVSAAAMAAPAAGGGAGVGSALGTGSSIILGEYKEGANGSRKLYGALIQALKENKKSNLLSTPSIVTMDNEEAYIVIASIASMYKD